MFKRIFLATASFFIVLSVFAQIEITFDITDNADRINCYTTSKTTNKQVLVTYQITDNSGCTGNCLYLWNDGEDFDTVKLNSTFTNVSYTSDGEFTPTLCVFDTVNIADTILHSDLTLMNITNGRLVGDSVEVTFQYTTPNGQFTDTIAFHVDEIDTASATVAASKIQVYSPVNRVISSEITKSPNSVDFEDYPYPNPSFNYSLTPRSGFNPFDEDIWVYYWDFGHTTPAGDNVSEKEYGSLKVTTDSVDHLFPYENLDGFTVRLVISLDSTQFTENTLNAYSLKQCYDYFDVNIVVEDGFFGETSGDVDIDDRVPLIPNVFTPNGDNVNEVFTFTTNGQNYFTLKVYSRWGNLVYEKEGYSISWDGNTNSGGNCGSGVYYYVLTSDAKDERHNATGFIHLFRE